MRPGEVTIPITFCDVDGYPVSGISLLCSVSRDGSTFSEAVNEAVEVYYGQYVLTITAAERGEYYTRVKATDGRYTSLVTVTTDEAMRGTDDALLAADYTAPANSDVAAIKAKTDNLPASPAASGDAMTLTAAERTSVASAVWAATTRTLSSFGTLVADVWAHATRSLTDKSGFSGEATNMRGTDGALTDKAGFSLTTEYDAAKSAANQASVDALPTDADVQAAAQAAIVAEDVAVETTLTAVKAKTDNLPAAPAATGDAMTLTPEYDHAKDDVLTPLAAVDGKVDAILAEDVGADLGTDVCTITLRDKSGNVVADARVYVSSDEAGMVRSDIRVTDALGQVRFDLTDGETYYLWAFSTRVDYTAINPIEFVAVAD